MKKTSIFKLLAGLALVVCAGFNLSNLKNKNVNIPEETEAVSTRGFNSSLYRISVPSDFGSDYGNRIFVSGYNSASHSWDGWVAFTDFSYNENYERVYTGTLTKYYDSLKFCRYDDNPNYCNTPEITVMGYHGFYWNGLDDENPGISYGRWTPSASTFYLYDYTNMFGGNAKCYAWQSHGSIKTADYPGDTMTKVQYGSGHLYSISLDPACDWAIFGVGDGANTGDLEIRQYRGQVFCWWDTGNGSFNDDLNWIKAHDWIYQTMHVRDILTTNNEDTGACRGDSGYYQKAKAAYNSFTTEIKTKISQDDCFEIACDRFHAWSLANGEDARIVNNTLTVNLRYDLITNYSNENRSGMTIVIIVSLLSISSLTVLLIIKRKKV